MLDASLVDDCWDVGGGGELVYLRGCQASENKDVLQAVNWKSGDHNEKDVKAVKSLSPRREPGNSGDKGMTGG